MAQDRVQFRAVLKTVMSLRFPYKVNNCQHLKRNAMDLGHRINLMYSQHCSQEPGRFAGPRKFQIRLVPSATSPTLLCCNVVYALC